MTDELRAKFEAWAKSRGYSLRRSEKNPSLYWTILTNELWDTWQAAHVSRDAEVADLRSIIDGQRDTIGALKRKLALSEAEVEALKRRIEDAPVYYVPAEKPIDENGWLQVIGSVKALNSMRGKQVRLVIDAAIAKESWE